MRPLYLLSQFVLWVSAVMALIVIADLGVHRAASVAVLAGVFLASRALSKAFPAPQVFVRNPRGFTRCSRTETADYTGNAAMSPGVGGIQR